MGQTHHRLTGGDNLSDIGRQSRDHPVGVRGENGVAGLAPGDIPLRRRRRGLGRGTVRRSLHLVIGQRRNGPALHQTPQPPLVRRRTIGLRPGCTGLGFRSRQGQSVVLRIKPCQHLAAMHMRPEVHQTLRNLAGNAKAEIRLDPGADHAAQQVAAAAGRQDLCRPDEGRLGARIGVLRTPAARE